MNEISRESNLVFSVRSSGFPGPDYSNHASGAKELNPGGGTNQGMVEAMRVAENFVSVPAISLLPVSELSVPGNTLFVNIDNSDKLSFKDIFGVVKEIALV